MIEEVEVFNKKGNLKSYTKERYDDFKNSEYSKVIHIWIQDGDKYLVQQRSEIKKIDPLHWSVTTGTKEVGESILVTSIRELEEEIGLKVRKEDLIFIGEFTPVIDNNPLNNHLASIYLLRTTINLDTLVLQESEVKDLALWSKEEILKAVKEEIFTDFSSVYPKYFEYIFDRSESI